MKAISLFSGGLDSQLAVCLIKEQGITVEGINFRSPFFDTNEKIITAAQSLGIRLHSLDLGNDYISDVIKNPQYGYGKNMNPCIDCHGFMFRRAGDMMQELAASFIITGEVVGQRPMSQNKSALNAVDKLSGYKGYILRPLSAKLLAPTIPEIEGWVDREQLGAISGRSRQKQIELAKEYGIMDYPSPAGGCLLTEANFSNRLRKLLEVNPNSRTGEMEILKFGRHFYLDKNLLVVGRNRSENMSIANIALESDLLIKVTNRPGPTGLLRQHSWANEEQIKKAASIVARYSDAKLEPAANIKIYKYPEEILQIFDVSPILSNEIPNSI